MSSLNSSHFTLKPSGLFNLPSFFTYPNYGILVFIKSAASVAILAARALRVSAVDGVSSCGMEEEGILQSSGAES
jgi:hypothetical protein